MLTKIIPKFTTYSVSILVVQLKLTKKLGVEREQLDEAVEAAASNEQRINTRRINAVTDELVARIQSNPEANQAFERIRERTIRTVYTMAGVEGQVMLFFIARGLVFS